ncbi:MAG TPA: hypothetical protein DEB39_06465 [Planctomycetaceae bacterium]|nr:hypothetical protein [Planctomycetaceae bacterium]
MDGHRLDVKREYDREIKARPVELERQFVGCMKTWGALLMGGTDDYGIVVSNITDTIERNMLEIYAGMIDRARKLGVRNGVTDYIADPEPAMSAAALDRHRDRVRFGLRTMSSSALLE